MYCQKWHNKAIITVRHVVELKIGGKLNGGIMNKLLKNFKISLLIIVGGLIVSALLSIIFSGFRIDKVSIINFEFFVGIIIAVIGGIMIASDYSVFRKKVIGTPIDCEVEAEENSEKVDWNNVLFYSGVIIVIAAIALGEIL